MKNIEDDPKKLAKLDRLMSEYHAYIWDREKQPLAAQTVALVGIWITDNLLEVNKTGYR